MPARAILALNFRTGELMWKLIRTKEQGQNAIEIPQFDPLIAEKEAEIATLRVPVPHVYELKPE